MEQKKEQFSNLKFGSIRPEMDSYIIKWMTKVYESMENKSLLAFDDEKELMAIIERGREYSCLVTNKINNDIAAVFLVNFYDISNPSFYGYYCGLTYDELQKAAVMDISMVDPKYRGLGLQKKTMEYAETKLTAEGFRYLLATVAPDNTYSYNNILAMGYKECARKSLYGGLDRIILMKEVI